MHLVTGGAGYFGEELVKQLVAQGTPVRIFDCNRPETLPTGHIEVVQGDIRDREAVHRACASVTHIHHNVAQVPIAKDKTQFWSVNSDGTRNLLEAALAAGVKKVVYTSSSAVFGVPAENPVTEGTVPSPAEEYGRAKLDGEHICSEYVQKGLDVTIVRPRTIVSHGRLGIFQILFEWVSQGYNIPVFGRGDNQYQFVHAEDLADGCVRTALCPGAEIFNFGTDRYGTMREALEALVAHARTGSRVRSLPMAPMELAMSVASRLGLSPLGPYHALMYGRSLYFDVTKAKRALGWQPRYSNSEMICEAYDWYCRHRDEVMRRRNASAHRSPLNQGALSLLRYVL
jgi:nucleoside-diphosphate-sugar epimerase